VTAQNGALEKEGGQDKGQEVTENWEIRNVDEEEDDDDDDGEKEEKEDSGNNLNWTTLRQLLSARCHAKSNIQAKVGTILSLSKPRRHAGGEDVLLKLKLGTRWR
jgi:hypothetical protein